MGSIRLNWVGCFHLSYGATHCFNFQVGCCLKKIGPKSTLIVCTVGCTLITIISGFIVLGGFSIALMIPLLFICRFLLGAFQGPLFPATAGGVIARWFPSGSWALQWNDFNGFGTWFCLNAPNNCLPG